MNDPEDNMTAEAERSASACELKGLTQLLLLAQEDERQRIAADLHDEIGQCLSAVQLSFGGLRQQLEDRLTIDEQEIFLGLAQRVAQGIEEIRRICMGLRPPMLDDLGIVSAIDWYCSELRRVLPNVELTQTLGADEATIPSSIKLSIFRILQEACANACKHARARRLSVLLETDAEGVRLEVVDDGIGFDVTSERRLGDGFGLAGMCERAAMSDGRLTIKSQAGEGTRVLAAWHIEELEVRSS